MKSFDTFLERQSARVILFGAFCTVIILGFLDHLIGPELSSAIFYVIPIAIASWYGNLNIGKTIGIISATVWLITDITSGREYSHSAIIYWNAFARLGLFLIISHLLCSFRERLRIEEMAADTDALTAISNAREFHEQLEAATQYARRYKHPITVAYIDLDNFKTVNDTYGHAIGDQLLITVAQTLNNQTRTTDVAARLGGDEFAILLPETDFFAANTVFQHTHQYLQDAMRIHDWPVTFSVGMVTFEQVPESIKEMIEIVDGLMYGVKKNQKNALSHSIWPEPEK